MQDKSAAISAALRKLSEAVYERRKLGPEKLKEKDKDKLSKIRNNIKRNSKK